MNEIFNAKWIKSSKHNRDAATVFVRSFDLKTKVVSAELTVTAHGVFNALLNGSKIGEDILAPGWTVYEKRLFYFTYDVTPLLSKGENLLEISVGKGWFFHKNDAWGNKNLKPDENALICALTVNYENGKREIIYSDENWQSRKSNIIYNHMYNGETLDLIEKEYPLVPVKEIEFLKENLIPSDGEPIREQERIKGQKLIITPKGEKVIDFGQEVTGYVEFTACEKSGTKIVLQHFEVLDKEGNVYTENLRSAKEQFKVISGGKKFTVKPETTFYGFRFIQVKGIKTVNPEDFTAIVVHSDIKRTARFSCSDPLLNRFAENVIWGQKGNFLDIPTDCPQRDERLGWTGDACMFSRTSAINFDVRRFYNKWFNDLAAEQLPSGSIYHVCPNPKYIIGEGNASPAWADVAVVAPWEIYVAYGDKCRLRKDYPMMKKWVDYMISVCREKGAKDGMELSHPWTTEGFGDWLSLEDLSREFGVGETDRGFIATAYLVYDIKILIKASKILDAGDMSYYEHVMENALDFIRSEYMKNGKMKQDLQTAETLALVFGLTDKPEVTAKQLVKNVQKNKRLTTGFIGSTYLLDALTMAGEDKLAVDLLLRTEYPSWLYPVTMGATTVWERWNGTYPDGHFASAGMNSFNHYAYGSVFAWIFRHLAGISPVEDNPGYAEVRFVPAPDERIPRVKAEIDTERGTVKSAYEKTAAGWKFTFTVPKKCKAAAFIFGETYELKAGKNIIEV